MSKVELPQKMMPYSPHNQGCGPFVTISRQFGCWGFALALLLRDSLNEHLPPSKTWKILNKEILERLAREIDLPAEILDLQRRSKPSLLVDFFRSLSDQRIPSGYEIRNRITTLIRGEAIRGHAIIVGQGGAGATTDLPHGLSIRLEAPRQWRIEQVAYREQVSESKAGELIDEMEEVREYLRKIYDVRFPRKPAFHLTYDCSIFTLAQIAQHVTYAMKLRGLIHNMPRDAR
ncbi:MAG: hypothetical protein EHM48_03575 [Planctomycetaceae bacterium]|nr:MAG: hypothetical protein EHM48_03575 [Planctomycetaceae bacterium]